MNKKYTITHTPLGVSILGIRACWQSYGKSDNGPLDLSLMYRVGKKFKHRSTVEHITIMIEDVKDEAILNFFKENPFSKVLPSVIFTNLRVLMENIDALNKLELDLSGYEFSYLLEDSDKKYDDNGFTEPFTQITFEEQKTLRSQFLFSTVIIDNEAYLSFKLSNISRALLQELARHRRSSLSVKSSRYTLKELRDTENIVPMAERITNSIRSLFNLDPVFSKETIAKAERFIVMIDDPVVNNYGILALSNLQKMVKTKRSNDITKYCMPESYKTELVWTVPLSSFLNFIQLRTSKAALAEIQGLSWDLLESTPDFIQEKVKELNLLELDKSK